MERKISSSLTEFYKVYGILAILLVAILFGNILFDFSALPGSIFVYFTLALTLFTTFEFWKMKEVEMTDSGLIISDRFFFTQKTIFVPFETIETAQIKLKWLGSKNCIKVRFTERTLFGNEISFIPKKFTRVSKFELVDEINQTAIRNKLSSRLNSAFYP